jgi:hypothetical protein
VILTAGAAVLTGLVLSESHASDRTAYRKNRRDGSPDRRKTLPASRPASTSRPARAGQVRFIRLKYSGKDWDANMGRGLDHNLLVKFNEITGFAIADNTEHKEISRLARFRSGKAPPFVYMTGSGGIKLSRAEVRILRGYCLKEGGMILADSAGGNFAQSFRAMCKMVFPDKKLVDIHDDDPLYSEPFKFVKGAPLLLSKKSRPQGIKHKGRWMVFYHPGNMGGLWKTGHSGASKALADRAYKLGINIMYYSFTRYLNIHHSKPTTRPGRKADQ